MYLPRHQKHMTSPTGLVALHHTCPVSSQAGALDQLTAVVARPLGSEHWGSLLTWRMSMMAGI